MLTVLLTALVLGVFIPIVQATTGTANEVRNRVVVDVYLKDDATPAEQRRAAQRSSRARAERQVGRVHLQGRRRSSPGSARTRPRRPIELLGTQPAARHRSASSPTDPDKRRARSSTALAPRGADRRAPLALAAIDEVRNREEDTNKILSATGLVKALTAGLAALLILASIALIANTIRLSIFARRREVEVMKLVGATNWFIRWPFVIEGVIVGFIGGLLAVLLLGDRQGRRFVDPLADRFALLAAPDTIDFPLLIVVLLLVVRGGLGARQRHHAAPLPARLARSFTDYP